MAWVSHLRLADDGSCPRGIERNWQAGRWLSVSLPVSGCRPIRAGSAVLTSGGAITITTTHCPCRRRRGDFVWRKRGGQAPQEGCPSGEGGGTVNPVSSP